MIKLLRSELLTVINSRPLKVRILNNNSQTKCNKDKQQQKKEIKIFGARSIHVSFEDNFYIKGNHVANYNEDQFGPLNMFAPTETLDNEKRL